MPISRQVPQVFNTTTTGPIVSSSSGWNFQLGFRPRLIQIENLGAGSLWLTFGTSCAGTSSGLMVSTGVNGSVFYAQLGLENGPPAISGFEVFSLFATSTVASQVNIWALG